MRILPVMDLLRGQVVRGFAGQRSEYRPVVSRLAPDATPRTIGQAWRKLGFSEIYVADLDAILGGEPQVECYKTISQLGCKTWIDAGLSDGRTAAKFLKQIRDVQQVTGIIAGLETLPGPAALQEIATTLGTESLVFSLDLKSGIPIASNGWSGMSPEEIVEAVLEHGLRRFIILDLAQVGIAAGVSTLGLCAWLRRREPSAEIATGGGVRNIRDLRGIATAGCDLALLATALHEGRITANELRCQGYLDIPGPDF